MTLLNAALDKFAISMQYIRVRECIFEVQNARRNVWNDKTLTSYLINYIFLDQIYFPGSNIFLTSVHVLYGESILELSDSFVGKLDKEVSVYQLIFDTKMIIVRNGLVEIPNYQRSKKMLPLKSCA
jgi:hypothetical protein